MTTAEIRKISRISWSETLLARSSFFAPRYWPATTAPPVAKAVNSWISRMLTESTRETADTAASPTLEIMTESAMPTNMARNCSATSGRMMRKMSLRLKISPSGGFFHRKPLPKAKVAFETDFTLLGNPSRKGKGFAPPCAGSVSSGTVFRYRNTQ